MRRLLLLACSACAGARRRRHDLVRQERSRASVGRSASISASLETPPLLVVTVNGAVHALDERTGLAHWTLRTGGALMASYQANGTLAAMLPTASGDLLEMSESGVAETGVSARKMVDMMPFSIAPPDGLRDGGPVTLLGTKTSRVFVVDSATGAIASAACSASDGMEAGEGDASAVVRSEMTASGSEAAAAAAGACEQDDGAKRAGDTILVSRSDYAIRAVQLGAVGRRGGLAAPRLLWNLSFSDLDVELRPNADGADGSDGADERALEQPGSARGGVGADEEEVRHFSADVRGRLFCSDCKWRTTNLESPVTRVFAAAENVGARARRSFRQMRVDVVRARGAAGGAGESGAEGRDGTPLASEIARHSRAVALSRAVGASGDMTWHGDGVAARTAFVLDMGDGAARTASGIMYGRTRSLVAVVGHAVDLDASGNGRGEHTTALALPDQVPKRALSLVPCAPRWASARDPRSTDLIVGHVTLGPEPPSYSESGLFVPGSSSSSSAVGGAIRDDAAATENGENENENEIEPPMRVASEGGCIFLFTVTFCANPPHHF